jgi:hypothetical protein
MDDNAVFLPRMRPEASICTELTWSRERKLKRPKSFGPLPASNYVVTVPGRCLAGVQLDQSVAANYEA